MTNILIFNESIFTEVVDEIMSYKTDLEEGKITNFSGDDLSKIAAKLAAHKVTLGTCVAQLGQKTDTLERVYDFTRKDKYKLLRDDKKKFIDDKGKEKIIQMSQEDAKVEADLKADAMREDWIKAKWQFQMAKMLREDTADLIYQIKDRMKALSSERVNV